MVRGERLNGGTHLLGSVLAVAALVTLVTSAAREGDPWKVVGASIFGATLVLLYAVSTLYHSLRGRAKAVLRKLDHCAIYLLIAGTYTPFVLVTLRGPWGWSIFGVVWGLAVLGIVQELTLARGRRWLSLAIYIAMGWLGLVAAVPLWTGLTPAGFAWLAAGGVIYTLGVAFFLLDERWPLMHGVWHLFVLGGSASHFVTVLLFVV
ncbi:MAG: hemolysin III family protein [Rubrivivax sp.]|nr:hemolysin III family protein [Rubrivivax sp.]